MLYNNDHYEVHTVEVERWDNDPSELAKRIGETKTVDSFLTYKEAKEFYDNLSTETDEGKDLIRVDRDGMSYKDAEENESDY